MLALRDLFNIENSNKYIRGRLAILCLRKSYALPEFLKEPLGLVFISENVVSLARYSVSSLKC